MAMTSLTHVQYIAELRKTVFENKLGHQSKLSLLSSAKSGQTVLKYTAIP